MRYGSSVILLVAVIANTAIADMAPTREAAPGELLYATHCIACHSAQVHWREAKLASDWASLQAQVRRWQDASGLGWSDRQIVEVARYLNALHYHYPVPESRTGISGGKREATNRATGIQASTDVGRR